MTAIEKKIYAALKEDDPSPMKVRQLYRRAWTASSNVYSRIDFNSLNTAIRQKFSNDQFRAIHSFGVTGK
jgi:hypothetical protein